MPMEVELVENEERERRKSEQIEKERCMVRRRSRTLP